jgi:transcription initiation factor TFIID subunit 5
MNPSRKFYNEHAHEHTATHDDDLKKLQAIYLPQHVDEDPLAKLYRENKFRVNLSKTTSALLMHFLEETEESGGGIILRIINERIELRITTGRPTMFSATGDEEGLLGEDEGIAGHTSGRLETGGGLPGVKLGLLPMDRDLMTDVEEELREEDARMKDVTRSDELGVSLGGGLFDEFQKIKKEESEDSPMRENIPLPPYTGIDVEREVRMVKESRDKMKLRGIPSPALPSVSMYTFHNTHDG